MLLCGLIIQVGNLLKLNDDSLLSKYEGWSDTEGRSDSKVFKELLRHMQDNKLYKVKAVVWCILPQPRMDAMLQSQARFIEMFTEGIAAGRIWSNVVIVCKGKASQNIVCCLNGHYL